MSGKFLALLPLGMDGKLLSNSKKALLNAILFVCCRNLADDECELLMLNILQLIVLLLVNVSHDHKIVIKSPFIFYTNYGSTTKIY